MSNGFTAPELVPTAFSDEVLWSWSRYVLREMDRDWKTLTHESDWLYQEALSYLCCEVLEALGVERPLIVAPSIFSDADGGPNGCDCELVLVWSAATHLSPGDVLGDCVVTRVTDFPLPPKYAFLNNEELRRHTVANWAFVLSSIVDDLPQKGL